MDKLTKQQKEQRKADSIAYLKTVLKPYDTVYTTITHVSSSGMSRDIKTLITVENKIVDIGWHVANALEWQNSKKNEWSIKVSGCGMDMGFHLVYSLSATLFPRQDNENKDTGYWLTQKWI